ncbi:MAG TPA: YHYH protein [Planctomycetota bacterium]|nr:YHYH protein [Planctomycetota bacterium]
MSSPRTPFLLTHMLRVLCVALWLLAFSAAHAHDGKHYPAGKLLDHKVSITIDGNERVIKSNGLPDHVPGVFPNRGNPGTISAQDWNFRMPLKPQISERLRPSQHASFGVAINGVPFEPGTAEFWNGDPQWKYEAMSGAIDLGLDQSHAHVQPGGLYHYHGLPTGIVERLGGDGKKMLLVGYAADGFPIYTSFGHADPMNAKSALRKMKPSWQLKKGERPSPPDGPGRKYDGTYTQDYEYVKGSGDLDECNGRIGVTPEYPDGIYHYYITDTFPVLGRYWRGTPDHSFFKKGPPGGGPGGRRGPPPGERDGPPPPFDHERRPREGGGERARPEGPPNGERRGRPRPPGGEGEERRPPPRN